MRAVNLIPGDARRRGRSSSAGIPFYGLVGGLMLVLLATVLLVTTENKVSSRESQLRVTQAAAARWTAVAGGYARDVSLEKQRGVKVSMVTSLAGQRYAWSQLLDQLASALPRTTTLSSLTSAVATPGTTSASTTSATATAAASSAPSQITLAACAPSQAGVAQTIVNLRRIRGVSEVLLSSTTSGSGTSGGGGGAACGKVSFGLTLAFAATTTAASPVATTAGTTAASTAATTTTAATSTSTATTAAASAPSTSSSTGASQ